MNVRERGIQQSEIAAAKDALTNAIYDRKTASRRDPSQVAMLDRAVLDAEKELHYLIGLKTERLERKNRGE